MEPIIDGGQIGNIEMRSLSANAVFVLIAGLVAPEPVRAADEAIANSAADRVDFARQVQPILSANCYACHGPDASQREAELRLDVRDDAVAARDGQRAIVPGKSRDSEVFRRITTEDADEKMPPPDSGHKLTAEQIALVTRWIDQGAEYTQHWSFVKPVRAALPKVKATDWPRNPIDYFVLAKLEAAGLAPEPEADRYTLNRRLSLDLTGLPPTPAEVEQFVNDPSADAYEKLVDRLLASDRYGEHWARMWLDLARYADTKGYEKDQPRDIWRYRDWVIDALNADMPYDQFTIEQLAGDLLPSATTDQILATAFHRNTMTNDEGGTDNEEFRIAAVKDRVDTTVQVWMGLTMGCAKCHSHKYDPITQREYYQFLAFFNQTEDADRGDDAPRIPTPTRQQQTRLKELRDELNELRQSSAPETPEPAAVKLNEQIGAIEKKIADLEKQIVRTPVMRELPENRRRNTHVHVRGNFLQPGDEVTPDVPQAFGPLPNGAPHNRLGVAQWLVDANNPLTARVAVNRFWARLFGSGLVETEEDFGSQGTPPSHAELLDWLAVEFRGPLAWSMKGLCKTIVMSATYRQSSRIDTSKLEADPQNTLLSRGQRFRLPAETVRDQALAAAGLLSAKIGGPSVMPPQPPGVWRTTYSTLKWTTSAGEDRHRRALYTFWRRTSPYPSLLTFDAGSREVCMIRRVRTNTPLQALVTLNDPVYVEAAAALGQRIMGEAGPDAAARATYGFQLVLIRPAKPEETSRLVALHESALRKFREDGAAATALIQAANQTVSMDSDTAEWAAWTVVGSCLLNLDETLMRN